MQLQDLIRIHMLVHIFVDNSRGILMELHRIQLGKKMRFFESKFGLDIRQSSCNLQSEISKFGSRVKHSTTKFSKEWQRHSFSAVWFLAAAWRQSQVVSMHREMKESLSMTRVQGSKLCSLVKKKTLKGVKK